MVCFISIELLLAWICLTSATVQLKVGLYNEIPDLQGDQLATYKSMVENGFNTHDHTVNAVVNTDDYSPYGSLNEYLNGDFDLIEIDTASLLDILDLIVDIETVLPMPTDTLPTARSAVQVADQLFGYPTLACGNFIIGLSPSTECTCPLRKSRIDLMTFKTSVDKCTNSLISSFPTYERLIGGKMNDADGWYLPFIYLDAYVDIYGPENINKAILELKDGNVDEKVCDNVRWFISQCSSNYPGGNKCYQENTEGSYVQSSKNVIEDIKNKKTMSFFGFSEKTAQIMLEANVCPYSATSWPLGPSNYMLQFTDALVVSNKVWEAANEDKRNAIRDFVKYFTGNDLRRKIALGEDLNPPRTRYLLQAIETFYKSVDDPIYQDLYWQLQRSVAAPLLSTEERKQMELVLEEKCTGMNINKIKTEL